MIIKKHILKAAILLGFLNIVVQAQLKSCSNYPCKNGGRCLNQPSTFYGYSCICNPPWSGVNCDQNRNSGSRIDINQNRNPGVNQYGNNQYGNNQYGSNQYGNGNNGYGNNKYGNNQYGSNQYGNNQYPNNQYPNSGSNIQIGGQNPFGGGSGSNIYLNNNNPYESSKAGACQMRPCKNGAYCQPGITSIHFKCLCRANYYGTHCEYYRQPKGALLGIVLGTILPFFGLVIIVSIVAYCCCCRK